MFIIWDTKVVVIAASGVECYVASVPCVVFYVMLYILYLVHIIQTCLSDTGTLIRLLIHQQCYCVVVFQM